MEIIIIIKSDCNLRTNGLFVNLIQQEVQYVYRYLSRLMTYFLWLRADVFALQRRLKL